MTEDARARAEALAARGRTLGGTLDKLRSSPGGADSSQDSERPAGTDLSGTASSWPSLLEKDSPRSQPKNKQRPEDTDDR